MNHLKSLAVTSLAFAALAGTGMAQAAACSIFGGPGVNAGSSSTADVGYGGSDATACVVSKANPAKGPDGTTSGFSSAFGTGWDLLGKFNAAGVLKGGDPFVYNGVTFTAAVSGVAGNSGGWTLSADQNVTLDLVLALRGGKRSDAFLFDDLDVVSGGNGTWEINWLGKNGQVPDYKSLTLFARDMEVTPVPEPETYALSLAGIAGVFFLVRRRRST